MPASYQVKLPVPADWQELQRMVCAVYKRVWNNDDLQEFGSIGQRQHGVDVFGHIKETGTLGGIQCKRVEKFTPSELEVEYLDALNFAPKLAKYLVITTTKKDTALQVKSAELNIFRLPRKKSMQ